MKRNILPVVSFLAGLVVSAMLACAAFDKGARDAAALPPVTADHAVAVPTEVAGAVAKASSGNVVGAIADLGTVVTTVNEVAQSKGEDGKPIGVAGAAVAIIALLLQRFRGVLPEWMSGPSASGARRPRRPKPAPVS